MKWSMFKAYGYADSAPTGNDIEVPIRCSSYLYTMVPTNGSTITLLSAATDGYMNLNAMRERVGEVLQFIPLWNVAYWCTTYMYGNPLFSAVASAAGVLTEMSIEDESSQYTGVPYTGGGPGQFVLGYQNMGSTINRATDGFTITSGYPCIGADEIGISYVWDPHEQTDKPHYNHTFWIYPEDFITNGKYDLDALYGPFDEEHPYVRTFGVVNIHIWFDYSLNKYNCEITLSGFNRDCAYFYDWMMTQEPEHVYDTEDPNNNDPNENNNGGNGDNDNGSDPIPMPNLPTTDMTAAGSLRIYSMTAAQVKSMFEYLHSNDPGDSIVKWWTNPIQGVVSCHYLPYAVKLKSGGAESIKICGMDTTVTATPAEQWQEINFGYKYIPTNKNTYLDRAPYTRSQIYLPGIGIRDLNTDDIIGKYVFVVYQCDNVSGQFVAYVLVSSTPSKKNASVRYSFSGSVAAPFPISQNNWGNTYIAAATLAAGALAAGAAVAGGAAAAGAAGASGAAAEGAAAAGSEGITGAAVAGSAVNVGSSLSQLAKPSITRSGTVSGTTSLFSVKRPYVILEKPNVQDYADFNKLKGNACGMTLTLGSLSGYTEVEKIHITGITATAPEISEIETLLRQGVIL